MVSENALKGIKGGLGYNKVLTGKIKINKVKVNHVDPQNIDTPCFSLNTSNDMKKCILSNHNIHEHASDCRSTTRDV